MTKAREWGRGLSMLAVLAGVALATNARADCSREMLRKLTDAYVKAQTDGKPAMLPLAKGAPYAENDQAMDIGKGGDHLR